MSLETVIAKTIKENSERLPDGRTVCDLEQLYADLAGSFDLFKCEVESKVISGVLLMSVSHCIDDPACDRLLEKIAKRADEINQRRKEFAQCGR
ncbi:hypothetical protein [Maritalea sp.]|uniref:hypothetical protein n=1 Tax=Maritalea sp. TaxID=2003361 RepID=UPI003EF81CD3